MGRQRVWWRARTLCIEPSAEILKNLASRNGNVYKRLILRAWSLERMQHTQSNLFTLGRVSSSESRLRLFSSHVNPRTIYPSTGCVGERER